MERLRTLERETGIEPATSGLGSRRSTAELLPLAGASISQRSNPRRAVALLVKRLLNRARNASLLGSKSFHCLQTGVLYIRYAVGEDDHGRRRLCLVSLSADLEFC